MHDTRIACLTPPGRGAIATLGVRGPQAWDVTRTLFRPFKGTLPDQPEERRFWYGTLGDECRDEVVLAVQGTLPAHLEIHCHGGPEVVRLLLELYEQRGVAPCTGQEFARLFANSERRAALEQQLQHAPTLRTASILWDQCHVRLADHARTLLDAGDFIGLREAWRRWLALIPLGRHLVQPWKVVIAGAPNVGKSSLVNALAGYTRSVVAPTAGTTRDVVSTAIAVDGWPVELLDTAGLRRSDEELEQAGIGLARDAIAGADLKLWVLDGSTSPLPPDDADGAWRFVVNKSDLPAAWNWSVFPDAVIVSAEAKLGVAELCDAIARWLVPLAPRPGEGVPCTPEECAMIERGWRLMGDMRFEEDEDMQRELRSVVMNLPV
jgi:tRNA modification GTPase